MEDGNRKVKKQKQSAPECGRRNRSAANDFTADMRFIVTRNKRNSWVDELYDTPPDVADYPVFN